MFFILQVVQESLYQAMERAFSCRYMVLMATSKRLNDVVIKPFLKQGKISENMDILIIY